jgi:hypothetical protein
MQSVNWFNYDILSLLIPSNWAACLLPIHDVTSGEIISHHRSNYVVRRNQNNVSACVESDHDTLESARRI